MKKFFPLIFIVLAVCVFFWQFIFKGLLPIPSDTIIGLYHPFRDLYAKNYPNGIPFKNFLITDPVRQQYPWRELSISMERRKELPLWNPYNFSGTPLFANFQSAVFYPFNLLLFIFPFSIGWSVLIFFAPLLAGMFTYLYLANLKINKWAASLGAISFSFSGFFVSWMEWGTVTHVALWIPLVLLSIDKIFSFYISSRHSGERSESRISRDTDSGQARMTRTSQNDKKALIIWLIVFLSSLVSAFFAGHLQVFFYLFILSIVYIFLRHVQYGRNTKILFLFLIPYSLFFILTFVQWYPAFQFIMESGRDVDQVSISKTGWFIPWQHLTQFIAPDFFGNPTTLNYWGVWNYGEFVGYTGIFPLILAFFALFFRHDKKTLFFGSVFFLSLIFSLPTFFAKIPYLLNVPFLSTSQPTRLLFITDFSLVVLAALGFDYFLKNKKTIVFPLVFIAMVIIGLWTFVFFEGFGLTLDINLAVAKSNLILPTILFAAVSVLIVIFAYYSGGHRMSLLLIFLIGITIFDLLRFGIKFTPFTNKEYLFPDTKTISFLKNQPGVFRIMTSDDRILPPNFSAIYRLQAVSGYDPLYLKRYAELIAASERGKPDINPPFGFNRIINPKNYDSKIVDLLGVKYVLSLSDIKSNGFKKVFQEGKVGIYENTKSLPRAFFVEELYFRRSKNEAINLMFEEDFDLSKKAVLEEDAENIDVFSKWSKGLAEITEYSENKIKIRTENKERGFLVLTDSFYPTWRAKIDGIESKIYRTDFNFRGIFIPKGSHIIEFYNSLF